MSIEPDSDSETHLPSPVHREFEVARSAGAWMPWVAFFSALGWWGAAAGGALAVFGWEQVSAAPVAILAAALMCIFLPGMLMIMAGFMARESTRSARANAIVMDAAAHLLSPSAHVASQAETFADQMRTSAASVDKAMNHALSALKAMSGELGDERLRVESVAYASADNARELAERLATERSALETIARDIRTQTDEMSEAIPRQAALMVEAAKAAGEEVAKAGDSLEQRLKNLEEGTSALAEKLVHLDTLAQDAGKRTQSLTYAIARVEEKLDNSAKTVDQAVRAGEMAAAAAGTTGDALRDAVSVALDGARDASAAIQQRTREASEEAAHALAELRLAGEEAANSIRAAGNAARAETDIAERRLHKMSGALSDVTRRMPEPEPQQARTPSAPPFPNAVAVNGNGHLSGVNGHASGAGARAEQGSLSEVTADPPRIAVPPVPLDDASDDVLFEGEVAAAPPSQMDANALRDHLRGEPNDGGALAPVSQSTAANGDAAWGDILADIDGPDQSVLPEDPEEGVRLLLERLQDSGIELARTFRPRDKRKISTASRKSDEARRNAVRSCASDDVSRVGGRLRGNPELRQLAEFFLSNEEDIALSYLEKTAKTGKNASPRLSAYLLIDAALS